MTSLLSAIDSSRLLCERFSSALSASTGQQSSSQTEAENAIPPLVLLTDAAQSLRAQTTKFSLLAISTPFTPSALVTVLKETNNHVLPSLATAALLTRDASYPSAFHNEAKGLVKDVFKEWVVLLEIVKVIAQRDNANEVPPEKDAVTVTAGRVWEACDVCDAFAKGGVVSLVMKKARSYLELVKDGIKELEEWDPEDDEEDEFFVDDLDEDFDPAKPAKEKPTNGEGNEDEDEKEGASELAEEKKWMLRFLNNVSKVYPAIETMRLKPLAKKYPAPVVELPRALSSTMESLLNGFREMADLVDEAAGSLYEHDLESSAKYASQVRKCAEKAVDVVRLPWVEEATGRKGGYGEEDKFTKWADTFLGVLEQMSKK